MRDVRKTNFLNNLNITMSSVRHIIAQHCQGIGILLKIVYIFGLVLAISSE